MLKLMHLFNRKVISTDYIKVLLIGGLFLFIEPSLSDSTKIKSIIKDKFVYKVSGEVYSINELKEYFDAVNRLKCIYPESLLFQVFNKQFIPSNRVYYKSSGNFTKAQKNYFGDLIKFGKLIVYSKSHDVVIKKSIEKYFYLSAKKSKCNLDVFKGDKTFKARFKEIVRLEIFMRSRFLPTEQQGKTTADDIKKAVSSSRNLISSINDQIDQEVYW